MAIDRLRQFSELVSPLPAATPDDSGAAGEGQHPFEVAASPSVQLQEYQHKVKTTRGTQRPSPDVDALALFGTTTVEVKPPEEVLTRLTAPALAGASAAASAACGCVKLATCDVVTLSTAGTQEERGASVEAKNTPGNGKEGSLRIGFFLWQTSLGRRTAGPVRRQHW